MSKSFKDMFIDLNSEEMIMSDLLQCLVQRMTLMGEYSKDAHNIFKDQPLEIKKLFCKYLAQVDHIFAKNYFEDCKELSEDIGFNYNNVKQLIIDGVEECKNDDKEYTVV